MKNTRKFLGLLLVVAMIMSFGVIASAESEPSYEGKIVILHTNDIHGRIAYDAEEGIIGYDGLATLKAEYERLGAEVILMDAADYVQGQPVVNVYQGSNVIEFMNAVGYDVATIGNHEFDFPLEKLMENVDNAEFEVVAANLTYKDGGELLFDDNTIFETTDGTKIGVFGMATPETLTKASPANTGDVDFANSAEALYGVAEEQVAELEEAGCDFIVMLSHLGDDVSSSPFRSSEVAENVEGIDIIIDGHAHQLFEEGLMVGDTLIASTGEYFQNVGAVIIEPVSGDLIADINTFADVTMPDAEITAVMQPYIDEVEAEYGEAFATTEVDLNGSREGGEITNDAGEVIATFPVGQGVRLQETNLGDFATDAILWQANQLTDKEVVGAITNGGGIRDSIYAGDITMNDMITVFPFGNQITLLDLTGAQILEIIEAATAAAPESLGAFPQVSGIEFTLNIGVPYVNGEMYPDSTYYAPANPGARVEITSIGGEEFDLEKTYTIASNDFLAIGGDTYYTFTQASYKYDTGIALEDALINYIAEELDGVIGEEYADADNRITIISAGEGVVPEMPFADIVATEWYVEPVLYNIEAGYLVGMSETEFAPAENMTRMQFMTIMHRIGAMQEKWDEMETTGENWTEGAIYTAELLGIGISSAEELMLPITREEICAYAYATLMYDMDGYAFTIVNEPKTFTDEADITEMYLDEVTAMYAAGAINGYPEGDFKPMGTATRAEIAQIIYNMMEVATLEMMADEVA